jgi:broad specificity polyphosphatase/5'/3'-nucleotidase SurE
MAKQLITYFFSLNLLISVAIPSYMSLVEETSKIEIVDIGEEEEKNSKESSKDLEVKNYYSTDNSNLYTDLENKKQISFYSKNYTSHQNKLISPPPEKLS